MPTKDLGRISEEQSKRFLEDQHDDRWAQIDLSSFPALHERQQHKRLVDRYGDETTTDPLFASLADDRPQSLGRKLTEMVIESSENEELARELRKAGFDSPAQISEFHAGDWLVKFAYDFTNSRWKFHGRNAETGAEKKFVIVLPPGERDIAITSAGEYIRQDENKKLWRELDDEDRLTVIRIAQTGNLVDAGLTYITRALRGQEVDHDINVDPKYAKLFEECAWFLFEETQPGWQGTDEQKAFFEQYLGNHVVDLSILLSAFEAWKNSNGRQEPQTVPEREEEVDLDELSDEEVSQAMHAVARESLRSRIRR